jgi:hypothetical protein
MSPKELLHIMKNTFIAAVVGLAAVAQAEPQRALLTRENQMPEYHQTEIGATADFAGFESRDETTYAGYLRFGLLTNLIFNAKVPFKNIEPARGSSESGVGDVRLGFELRAYEDIFGYPYCIPHADVDLSTGEEDKGLGKGEVSGRFGVSVGTRTCDEELHWVADLTFAQNEGGTIEEPDDVVIFALSLVWDVSKKFAVSAEGSVSDEDTDNGDTPLFGLVGMGYKFTPDFMLSWYAGGGTGGSENEESLVTVKAAYTF